MPDFFVTKDVEKVVLKALETVAERFMFFDGWTGELRFQRGELAWL